MPLKFLKLIGQIVCTEHDDAGNVTAEKVVGEVCAYPLQLDALPAEIRRSIDQMNAVAATATPEPPAPNRAARRANPKPRSDA